MKELIKKMLHEALIIPSLRVPKNIKVSDEELAALNNVSSSDIQVDDLGGNGNIAHLGIKFPFDTQVGDGIVVDIQVLNGNIYQIHIHMADSLHGIGLGYKIYKAVIREFGHLYSGKGRRMNQYVTKIWEKLKNDPEISCVSNKNGDLCMTKDNPNKEDLINFIH